MNFVIIGNGVAGITAALTIRKREPAADITVISGESDYFFSRTALMYAYMNRMSRRDLEPYERSVWKKQRIHLVRDWVTGLNANSQFLTLASGAEMPYDRLLIATGSVPNRIPWKGLDLATEGVVNFVSLQDLDACERLTRPGAKAVVTGGGLIGVELVECLAFHQTEVTFLVREPWYWPIALAEEEGLMISEHIRRQGVELLVGETVNEIYTSPDGRVSGVSTESGARFDCEILGVTAGVRPAVDWLREMETPPDIGRGIIVSADFRTSLKNVWAAGDAAEIHRPGQKPLVEQIWYSAKRHGELAALSMLGDGVAYAPPVFYNSSKFFEIEYTTAGRSTGPPDPGSAGGRSLPEGSRSFYSRVPGREVSMRIVEREGAVIGFNMLGSRWDHTFFERWIEERRSLDYVVERLHEAQFDVEYGRQSLATLRDDYRRWKNGARESG